MVCILQLGLGADVPLMSCAGLARGHTNPGSSATSPCAPGCDTASCSLTLGVTSTEAHLEEASKCPQVTRLCHEVDLDTITCLSPTPPHLSSSLRVLCCSQKSQSHLQTPFLVSSLAGPRGVSDKRRACVHILSLWTVYLRLPVHTAE